MSSCHLSLSQSRNVPVGVLTLSLAVEHTMAFTGVSPPVYGNTVHHPVDFDDPFAGKLRLKPAAGAEIVDFSIDLLTTGKHLSGLFIQD